MKEIIIAFLGIFLAVFLGVSVANSDPFNSEKFGDSGYALIYSSPTHATSTVGIYTPTLVLEATSGRRFASFCNLSNALPASNDALFLELGATSTDPTGIIIKPRECYEMRNDNLFVGNVYAVASTSTTTLLTTYK